MLRRIFAFALLLAFPFPSSSWGFFGHRSINRLAVYTLPSQLMVFFKQNIEFISEHAVDADMRRHAVDDEAPRHYIDIDHYGDEPFELMPRIWDSAVSRYSEDTLIAYGIVPWHVQRMYYRLVDAYRKRDVPYILQTAADLGHYVGDAHVPLHTTLNYNGQLTGQHGIHGLWESRLPELFSDEYDFFVGRAERFEDPLEVIWNTVEQSHSAVDSVLKFEKDLSNQYAEASKYGFEERGGKTVKTYSVEYAAEYHARLDRMVERRMRKSIKTVGDFWYSAWIEAGQPILGVPLSDEALQEIEEECARLREMRTLESIKGRDHE